MYTYTRMDELGLPPRHEPKLIQPAWLQSRFLNAPAQSSENLCPKVLRTCVQGSENFGPGFSELCSWVRNVEKHSLFDGCWGF